MSSPPCQSENLSERQPDNSRLTPRQIDVLRGLHMGHSNKQIARDLGLSEGTVKVHCKAIFRSLGVRNRTQAALLADRIPADLEEGGG